jgi:hypothetical protein
MSASTGSGGEVRIVHSTVTNNRADADGDGVGTGGGIDVSNSNTTVTIDHTIVAGNFRGTGPTRNDISGPVTAAWSLIGDNTGATITDGGGNRIGTSTSPISPGLAPLAYNGGPTMTHRPLVGSEAIDAGNPGAVPGVGNVPTFDQRGTGYSRAINVPNVRDPGNRVDIGALEVNLVGAPKIVNVVLKGVGTGWGAGVEYSYAELVAAGDQLRPMFMQGANRIEVYFDVPVVFPTNEEDALSVITNDHELLSGIGFDQASSTSTKGVWTLSNPLGIGKFALMVSGIKNANDNTELDGDYTNFHGPDATTHTYDDFSDDKRSQLISGNGMAGGIFRFHFSVLTGDYNQDGIVTSADAVASTVKDGDGDGTIENGLNGTTTQDTAIATGGSGTELPLRRKTGDYADLDNDLVDVADYLKWRATFNHTNPPLPADGNVNGTVDAADFVIWRDNLGLFSAWRDRPMAMAAALPIIDFGNAARVVDVIVSGSESNHNPHYFDDWDYNGLQLQRVPVGGADTISIVFSEDVNVSASFLRVVGLFTGNVPTLAEFSYDVGTMTATWRFEDWASADMFVIALDDAVTDVQGNRLDGDWLNPRILYQQNGASQFPSGDSDAGGDFNFVITLLPGDASGNGEVDSNDYWYLYNAWYYGLQNQGLEDGDCDGDGVVTQADFDIWAQNNGVVLTNVWMLADLDEDFDVDQSDLDAIVDNLGMTGATWEDGDLNGDSQVDEDDLDLAFAQYGLALAVVS